MPGDVDQGIGEFAKQAIRDEFARWWPAKEREIYRDIEESLERVHGDVRARVDRTIDKLQHEANDDVHNAVSKVEKRAFATGVTFLAALIAVTYMGARQAAITGQIEVQKELIALQKDLKAARDEANKATREAEESLRKAEDSLRKELAAVAEERRKINALTGEAETLRAKLAEVVRSSKPLPAQ